jgi:integrase
MGRPTLPIGSHGEIYTLELDTGGWLARAQFRDADGVTRPVKRHGASKPQATRALRAALAERSGTALAGEIARTSRLSELAHLWLAEQERLAAQGSKQMTSVDQYRDHYRRHIDKALGRLQLHECTVSVIHRFLVKLAESSSSTAVMCRKVLSGMLGYAVIHRALPSNPVRDVGRIKRTTAKPARALEAEQVLDWLTQLDASEYARTWDLPDLSRFLLATGLRIGEALAVDWSCVDFAEKGVRIAWRVVTIKGKGVQRVSGVKTDPTGERPAPFLDLPSWAMTMLRKRKLLTGGRGDGWTGEDSPLFPQIGAGGWRDPREVGKALRVVRGDMGYPWLTSHSLGRKTVATILDRGGASAREIADQLNHARPSMTQDVYMAGGRRTTKQAAILEQAMGL